MSRNIFSLEVVIPGVLGKLPSYKVLSWYFGEFDLSIWLLWINPKYSNIRLLCERTVAIPQLPGLFSMATVVSSTVEQVKSVASDSVNYLTL
jgi:hypothetical protein